MANQEKSDEIQIGGRLEIPGIGGISLSKTTGLAKFRIVKPEAEYTDQSKVHLMGEGGQSKWRIIIINWLLDNRCYLQKDVAEPNSLGEWTAQTVFSPESQMAERLVYAVAIKPKDVDRVLKLLDQSKRIPNIQAVEQILKGNRIWYKLSPSKRLIYRSETPELGNLADKVTREVTAAYLQILERSPDEKGLLDKGKRLEDGRVTLKGIIRELGKSDEYFRKFVLSKSPVEIIRKMYLHFLGREPESTQFIQEKVAILNKNQDGWKEVVNILLESDEYYRGFGEHKVPAKH